MDQMFAPEYFDMIFRFLPTYKDLHSCLLVNRHWATCVVPILWEAPFKIKGNYIPSPKVIKTYLAFIPDKNCHNIENLIASICYKNEGMALAVLIRSQKRLKKFSLINSNNFASFPVQALMDQKHSLKSVTFEDMHQKNDLTKTIYFKYFACQLNSSAINALAQCTNINKLKFKHCEGINSPAFFSFGTAFSNLTSLEYSYGAYDNMTPIQLLSDLIMTSCNTLKKIILEWHSLIYLDITQLVKIITQHVINLEYLKIPLNTLEQLALIHRTHNPLRRLEIHMDRKINLHCALSLLANVPLKSREHSIHLSFGHNENLDLKINLLNQIFESIFYKSNRIVDFILHLNNDSIENKENLLRNYPRLKINILSGSILRRYFPGVMGLSPE
ncbi:3129_t:CDS:2, partial [Cetraspora pellucida]